MSILEKLLEVHMIAARDGIVLKEVTIHEEGYKELSKVIADKGTHLEAVGPNGIIKVFKK